MKGAVESELSEDLSRLRPEEAAVLGLLQARLSAAGDSVRAGARVKPAGTRMRGSKKPRDKVAAPTTASKTSGMAETAPKAKRASRVRRKAAAA